MPMQDQVEVRAECTRAPCKVARCATSVGRNTGRPMQAVSTHVRAVARPKGHWHDNAKVVGCRSGRDANGVKEGQV